MVIVEIVDGSRAAVFMVRASDSAIPRRVCRVGEFETDAAMLHYVVENGHLRSLSVVGGQHVITAHERWLSLAADAPFAELHVAIRQREDRRRIRRSTERADGPGDVWMHRPPHERTRFTT